MAEREPVVETVTLGVGEAAREGDAATLAERAAESDGSEEAVDENEAQNEVVGEVVPVPDVLAHGEELRVALVRALPVAPLLAVPDGDAAEPDATADALDAVLEERLTVGDPEDETELLGVCVTVGEREYAAVDDLMLDALGDAVAESETDALDDAEKLRVEFDVNESCAESEPVTVGVVETDTLTLERIVVVAVTDCVCDIDVAVDAVAETDSVALVDSVAETLGLGLTLRLCEGDGDELGDCDDARERDDDPLGVCWDELVCVRTGETVPGCGVTDMAGLAVCDTETGAVSEAAFVALREAHADGENERRATVPVPETVGSSDCEITADKDGDENDEIDGDGFVE